MKLFGLTKQEIRFIVITLAILWSFAGINLLESQVLARDVQRKNDLKHIATALEVYRKNESGYPLEKDGKMFACFNSDNLMRVCNWGSDPLATTTSSFINPLPEDPLEYKNEASYLYLANTRDYQLFSALEKKNDSEYNKNVYERKLPCGARICNFSVTSGVSPTQELGTYLVK